MTAHPIPWVVDAACRGMDPDIFFPPRGNASSPDSKVRSALAVCRECSVRAECLAYALTLGAGLDGVWGGTTHKQRRQMRRRRTDQIDDQGART